jgi:hypothetical protein
VKPKSLEDLLRGFREDVTGVESSGHQDMAQLEEFLVKHGGLKALALPGRRPQLLEGPEALQCFHFSQFLEWYLPVKQGASARRIEEARATLLRFNAWLLEQRAILRELFEENLEAILGETSEAMERRGGESASPDEDTHGTSVPEEQDFNVPGEYAATLSGEFTLTKVQEGILYGRLAEGGDEIGPILVERTVSSGHRVGDRVHLALGRAGDHWNLLGEGRRRD